MPLRHLDRERRDSDFMLTTPPASTRIALDERTADGRGGGRVRPSRRARRAARARRANALAGVFAGRRARRDSYSASRESAPIQMFAATTSWVAREEPSDAALAAFGEQDAHVEEHVERVGELSARVARALGLPEHETRRIGLAGRLHDIGKAAIPTSILGKPGPLDEREWHHMRQHTVIGEQMVLSAPGLAEAAPLIRSSHERVDGTGYPDRLSGASIPLGSRIIAVCDAFDAMTTDRVYRAALGTCAALEELSRHAGSQFDPTVVAALSSLPGLSDTALAEVAA
jgi:HD-GYP domain-containing protein (c-di-GMP phosphodiesterase class II)